MARTAWTDGPTDDALAKFPGKIVVSEEWVKAKADSRADRKAKQVSKHAEDVQQIRKNAQDVADHKIV